MQAIPAMERTPAFRLDGGETWTSNLLTSLQSARGLGE